MWSQERDRERNPYVYTDALLKVVDRIRADRQNDARNYPRDDGKKFTKEDVDADWREAEIVTLHALSNRRRKHVHRYEVLYMAEYFECEDYERNEMLAAAGYPVIPVDLDEDEFDRAMRLLRGTMERHTEPAYIVRRDWTIEEANQSLSRLFDEISGSRYDNFDFRRKNLLELIFDKQQPIRELLRPNWRATAERNLYLFRQANIYFQTTHWYKDRVASTRRLDPTTFDALWKLVHDPCYKPNTRELLGMMYRWERVGLSLRITQVPMCEYPQLWYYLPAQDMATQRVYKELGFLE